MSDPIEVARHSAGQETPLWVVRTRFLWERRGFLGRVLAIASVLSILLAFLIPKRYTATARIMPPDQQGSSSFLLAALAGRGGAGNLGALGSLAGDLLGGRTTTALFLDLLRSGTVTGKVIDRFELQHVYRKRYRVDTAKLLAKRTSVLDDKKSGVITISVQDTDPIRARDMTQAYLDGLNALVTRTNTSAAHQERVFIEGRLTGVKQDLARTQQRLSLFSSSHSTIDIREQTHAMVDAGARLQGQLLAEQAGLQSLLQIYGNGNVRVRSAQARISALQQDLRTLTGTPVSASLIHSSAGSNTDPEPGDTAKDPSVLYPPLRQLPALAVPYADLVREVRVQETIYELLTQQYELARLEEAKSIPVVKIIDPPGVPEKKSFPPRLWLSLGLTGIIFAVTCAALLLAEAWRQLSEHDPRKSLVVTILEGVSPRRPLAVRGIGRKEA